MIFPSCFFFTILFFFIQSDLVDTEKMQEARVCPCTNTPGDSNNNAAVPGSFRAARAVRPFVSRGHSLHYNPRNKAPSGACARPRRRRRRRKHCSSLHARLSAFASQQETHSSEFKKKTTKIKAPTMRRCTGMTRLTWRGEDDKWEEREENGNEAGP